MTPPPGREPPPWWYRATGARESRHVQAAISSLNMPKTMQLKELPLVALHWQPTCSILSQISSGREEDQVSQTNFNRRMPRKLVWVDGGRFLGFACSECSWRFDSSAAPTGKSFDEMMRNFELQRDKEFTSHVCADHPRSMGRSE